LVVARSFASGESFAAQRNPSAAAGIGSGEFLYSVASDGSQLSLMPTVGYG